jgi:hypothetical protein
MAKDMAKIREEYRRRSEDELKLNKLAEEGKRIHEQLRTPEEVRLDTQENLLTLFMRDAISAEDYERGMKASKQGGKAGRPGGLEAIESRFLRGPGRTLSDSERATMKSEGHLQKISRGIDAMIKLLPSGATGGLKPANL